MKRMNKSILILTIGLMGLAFSQGAAFAQTEIPVNYTWTAPTTGTPVAHYIVQHSVNAGEWTQIDTAGSNTYTLVASIGDSHQIRVAGVDSEARQGPYSVASDAFIPNLISPGEPGKPIVF